MSKRHKHYDVIVAWAEGEEVEFYNDFDGWIPIGTNHSFIDYREYRIKPKTVKKEGWVNVYEPLKSRIGKGRLGDIWETKELADEDATPNRKACIRIAWEEEQ